MCLAVPGMVVEVASAEPPFQSAVVEFGGVRRQISLACVPEAAVGDYVLVHAGVAISRIDQDEAARVLQALAELDLDDEEADESPNLASHKPR